MKIIKNWNTENVSLSHWWIWPVSSNPQVKMSWLVYVTDYLSTKYFKELILHSQKRDDLKKSCVPKSRLKCTTCEKKIILKKELTWTLPKIPHKLFKIEPNKMRHFICIFLCAPVPHCLCGQDETIEN